MNKYLLGLATGVVATVAATVVAKKYENEIREYTEELKELIDELACKYVMEQEEYKLSEIEK